MFKKLWEKLTGKKTIQCEEPRTTKTKIQEVNDQSQYTDGQRKTNALLIMRGCPSLKPSQGQDIFSYKVDDEPNENMLSKKGNILTVPTGRPIGGVVMPRTGLISPYGDVTIGVYIGREVDGTPVDVHPLVDSILRINDLEDTKYNRQLAFATMDRSAAFPEKPLTMWETIKVLFVNIFTKRR